MGHVGTDLEANPQGFRASTISEGSCFFQRTHHQDARDARFSRENEMPVIFCRTHGHPIRRRIPMSNPIDIGRVGEALLRDDNHGKPSENTNTYSNILAVLKILAY